MSCHCNICPNNCIIPEGGTGKCGIRKCLDGSIALPGYGRISALAVDPVEKKPLFHFHPGTSVLSAGFFGCNLSCPFCQNYSISREYDSAKIKQILPDELVSIAYKSGCKSFAFTYNEPVIHFEYITETAKKLKAIGISAVLVTNGYINPEPADELLNLIDAVNIDLKAFSNSFYRNIVGGKLEPVLEFIKTSSKRVHTEVTTLVIPGYNDSKSEIISAAEFLANLNPLLPYHLTAYYPSYKFTAPPTEPSLIFSLAEYAKKALSFVYTGNVPGGDENTFCPRCGSLLIRRNGYNVSIPGFDDNNDCNKCGLEASAMGIIA